MVQVALWMKFLFIASFSGVGAIANAPAGVIRSDAKWRAQVTNAMTEIYTLAQARGINSPSSSIETVMASVDALPEDATRSMQRDIAAGKPSELDHRTEQSYAWPVKPPLTFQHMSSYTER
jgi:2-dehydropantoate 2-reductase